ncbi:membrane protein [Microbacterium phage Gretchen]|nr:membrane protein [Microbacterium phage Gretchen]
MSAPQTGPAVITLREVYDLVVEVKDSVAVVPAHSKTLDDHEARIRVQEARKTVSPRDLWTGITGAAAAGAAIASIINALIP